MLSFCCPPAFVFWPDWRGSDCFDDWPKKVFVVSACNLTYSLALGAVEMMELGFSGSTL